MSLDEITDFLECRRQNGCRVTAANHSSNVLADLSPRTTGHRWRRMWPVVTR
jgi:hypothetical protein